MPSTSPWTASSPSCCSSWLTGSRPTTTSSFTSRTHFVGSHAYSVEMLRADLARFAFLLGVMCRGSVVGSHPVARRGEDPRGGPPRSSAWQESL